MNEQQKACTELREMVSSVLEKARKYRKWNLLTALGGMVAIVLLYVAGASRASYSDNIGVFLTPLVVLFLDGPAISVLAGIVQVLRMKHVAHAEQKSVFGVFLATQPRVFLVLGCFGIVGVIWAAIKFGPIALLLPLFPFWPIKYLF